MSALPPTPQPAKSVRLPVFSSSPLAAPHTVLFGPFGLRAGWGILLFLCGATLLGTVFFAGLSQVARHLGEAQRQSPPVARGAAHAVPAPLQLPLAFVNELSQGAAILLMAFGLGRLEGRPLAVYGLPRPHRRDALFGAVSGFVLLSLLVGLLRALHLLVFDRRLLDGNAALRFGAGWLLVFLLVGFFEEFLFRGYIQSTLTRGLLGLGRRLSPTKSYRAAFWLAAVCWSLFFLLTHLANAGENPFGLVAVFTAGMVFSYALWRTGSLWWGIGFHAAWDWAQSFLYGVPDSGLLSAHRLLATHPAGNPLLSGGADGPEGSLFVLPILLLVPALLAALPARPQPSPESHLTQHSPAPLAEQPGTPAGL